MMLKSILLAAVAHAEFHPSGPYPQALEKNSRGYNYMYSGWCETDQGKLVVKINADWDDRVFYMYDGKPYEIPQDEVEERCTVNMSNTYTEDYD